MADARAAGRQGGPPRRSTRRATTLLTAAPKLRSKDADGTLAILLSEDAQADVAGKASDRSMPEELRWREWMGRVEAVIFASPTPVSREALARVVGPDCNVDLLIDDIRAITGGFQHRTRKRFAETIRASVGLADGERSLSQLELLVLAAIAYYQPISRGELGEFLGREVSRDLIGRLRSLDLIAAGPRSPRDLWTWPRASQSQGWYEAQRPKGGPRPPRKFKSCWGREWENPQPRPDRGIRHLRGETGGEVPTSTSWKSLCGKAWPGRTLSIPRCRASTASGVARGCKGKSPVNALGFCGAKIRDWRI